MLRWMFILPLALVHWAALGSVVFSNDTEWRYVLGRSEASPGDPTAWRQPSFDDSTWAIGQAPFYYDDQPTSATAYTGNTQLTDMRGSYTCIFLRKHFTINNPSDVQSLELASFSDDGFIAWINGREVARFNMPAGDIPFDGTSLAALSEPVPIQTNVLAQADAPLLPATMSSQCKRLTPVCPAAAILSFPCNCLVPST